MFPKWLAVITGIATIAGLAISVGQLILNERKRAEQAAITGWASGKAMVGESITKQELEMIQNATRKK